MRSLALVLTLLFGVLHAKAADYNYKDYWKKSDIQVPEAKVSLFVKDSPLPFLKGIANITVSHDNTLPLEKVVQLLKNSIATKHWNVEKIDGLTIYETVEPQSGNLFRIATNSKNNQYSFGAVKLRYLMPSYVELHLLQVEQLTGAASKSSAKFLLDLFLPKAAAVDWNAVGATAQNAVVDTGNKVLAPTNSAITGAATTLSNGGQAAATTLSNGGQAAATTLSNGGQAAATTISNGVQAAATTASDGMKSAAGTFKETVSTKNAAKVAAAGAATGVLVAALTTFAVVGAWDLAKAAYYEIKGEFTPKEKAMGVEAFEHGMKVFEQLAPQAQIVEAKLNRLTLAMDSASRQSTEESLARMQGDLRRLEAERNAPSHESGLQECLPCKNEQREKKIMALKQNIADIQESLLGTESSCEQLGELSATWKRAELSLTQAKQEIIDNASIYVGFLNQIPEVNGFQRQRKKDNACRGENQANMNRNADDIERFNKTRTPGTAPLDCQANSSSQNSLCREYRSYVLNLQSCDMLTSVAVGPGSKADLKLQSAELSHEIAKLSVGLSRLDCEKGDGNSCVVPGAFTQVSIEMKNKFDFLKRKCPNSDFLAHVDDPVLDHSSRPAPAPVSAAVPAAPANTAPSRAAASAPVEKPGFFRNLYAKMFERGPSTTTESAVRTATDYQLSESERALYLGN